MANVNGDEFAALWAVIAELRAVTEDARERLGDQSAALLTQLARLDRFVEQLQDHGSALTMLALGSDEHTLALARHTAKHDQHTATLAEHGAKLDEILRRFDAA